MKKSIHYEIHNLKTPNNLPVFLINNFASETVTVMVLVKTGARYEKELESGTAHFLEHMFFKGTKHYPNSSQLAMEIELLGGITNAFTSYEYTGYYIKVPLKNYEKAVKLLADIIINPVFKKDELDKERGVIAEEIRMYNDLPYEKVASEFNAALFGKHPLGRDIAGTIKSIGEIDEKVLTQFRDKYYFPENMLLMISGDVTIKQSKAYVQRYFNWAENLSNTQQKFTHFFQKPYKQFQFIKQKTEQAHLVMGSFSYQRNDPMEYPLKLGMTILTDGFGSKLFQTLREKYGIAYYVSGSISSYQETGKFMIKAGVSLDKLSLGINSIRKSVDELLSGDFTSSELARAKNYQIAVIGESTETGEDKAFWYGMSRLLNKKHLHPQDQIEEIESISRDLIINSWQRIISVDNLLLTVLSNSEENSILDKTSLD